MRLEFFVLRGALSDDAVKFLYFNALLSWPTESCSRSHLSCIPENKIDWLDNFLAKSYSRQSALEQLRWITLGYHYDWTNKTYPEECYSPFPEDASKLFQSISSVIAAFLPSIQKGSPLTAANRYSNFVPQAAIVNYYRKKTTMGFHVDAAEPNRLAPLISVSLGRPCIFLLEASENIPGPQLPHEGAAGVLDESTGNTILPIILHHGDVLISGGSSRLAYHAVPKLLCWDMKTQLPSDLLSDLSNNFIQAHPLGNALSKSEVQSSLEAYVHSTRVNMNVRQVTES
uniref:Alkylated DNA repair protein alkB homolog 1 n=1 Tax=Schistocephalus solidus TaxID=70667 RepID=A0A0X3PT29_SCHSO